MESACLNRFASLTRKDSSLRAKTMSAGDTFRCETRLARGEPGCAFACIAAIDEDFHALFTMTITEPHVIGRAFISKIWMVGECKFDICRPIFTERSITAGAFHKQPA